ncbi:hypothetical protein [Pantoea sp. GbtcB22]|uniref:hypothetical protein n=1 Tax=Pantoea sp. GbtcB22 TaxID=2824767 RepID=UPI001C2F92EF|nr:hypothetical protein [Pantoea sp. GbtcB22]
MATGDQNDILNRLKALLPPTWFDSNSPFLDGVLTACAQALTWCYSLYVYAKLQTRIGTATDGWLDLTAYDFFGKNLQRAAGQSDELFRQQMKISLFRERGTRQAIIDVLEDLTGKTPHIFEPQRPLDTGAYGGPMIGYGVAGGYGSLKLPYQAFVTAYRPSGAGIPFIAGYSSTPSGYSIASRGEYASQSMITGSITDAQVYEAIAAVKMEGTIVWVRQQ